MKCVLLAAGKSSRMFSALKKPKCLLEIENKTLIEKLILNLKGLKIKKIYIVVGFKSHLIKKSLNHLKFINFIHNKNYAKKEMLYSMILTTFHSSHFYHKLEIILHIYIANYNF